LTLEAFSVGALLPGNLVELWTATFTAVAAGVALALTLQLLYTTQTIKHSARCLPSILLANNAQITSVNILGKILRALGQSSKGQGVWSGRCGRESPLPTVQPRWTAGAGVAARKLKNFSRNVWLTGAVWSA